MTRRAALLLLLAMVTSACSSTSLALGPRSVSAAGRSLIVSPSCSAQAAVPPIVAVTPTGSVVAIDPQTLQVDTTIAKSVDADGGVAVGPSVDVAFVTARGGDGLPAVWQVPLAACHEHPSLVASDAELPSVSPDGGFLAYVTVNNRGEQTGVDIVPVDSFGRSTGPTHRYPATVVPPPLPITGLAVGRDDAKLAVWGGFVDAYLGRQEPTVGTLTPATAQSLNSPTVVFDGEGVSIPNVSPTGPPVPKFWQTAPVFLPDGELLVGSNATSVIMPFTDTTPGLNGGGFDEIVPDAGQVSSLAAGATGTVAWIGPAGTLFLEPDAVDLPYGPEADTPTRASAPIRTAKGHFEAIAWTVGPTAQSTPLPRVYHIVAHLPNVVGMSEPAASQVMNALDLPVLVESTLKTAGRPPDTVIAQNPPAGDGVDCQCTIVLTVTAPATG